MSTAISYAECYDVDATDCQPQFMRPSEHSRKECEAWFRDILDAVPTGWIAGGCMRDYFSRTPCTSDVDVFFPSLSRLLKGIELIEAAGATKIADNKNTVDYMIHGRHVQLVKGHFRYSLEDTLSRFDFTVCSCGIDFEGRVLMHPCFLEDLAARRLVINDVTDPLGTFERLQRYAGKGFKADNASLLKLAMAMQDIDPLDFEQNSLEFYAGGVRRFGRFDAIDEESIGYSTEKARQFLSELALQG